MTTADLEAIAAGKRTIDSTEAPQIARELLAARRMCHAAKRRFNQRTGETFGELKAAIDAYDEATKGE